MKKLAILFAGLFIMAISVQNVNAQISDSDDATAAATIIELISITQQGDLFFGNIAASAAGGTVVIASDGVTAPAYVGVIAPDGNEGTRQAASFLVEGMALATYDITLPGSITINDGSNSMTVDNFTTNSTETLDGSGDETILVGATLNVGTDQPAGTYQGNFTVSVIYN
jgi:hypothetical protein